MFTFNFLKRNSTLFSICSLALVATSSGAKANEIEEIKCFEEVNLEPAFIALTTFHGSSLANWYSNLFKLKKVKDFSFPDGSATGTLMKRGDFVIEVFNRKKPIVPEELRPEIHRTEWNGVLKVGIFTDADLDSLKSCLVKNNVNARRIYDDKNLKVKLLQVMDPENNFLEIISRTN